LVTDGEDRGLTYLGRGYATLGRKNMALSPSAPVAAPAIKDIFATTVHELRSPLTTISGRAQLARRFVAKDPAREREALDLVLALPRLAGARRPDRLGLSG
jgi:signal transduction histidine kinase